MGRGAGALRREMSRGPLVCLLLLAGALRAEDDRFAKDVGNPALQRKINEAIDKGVAYLKSTQRSDGHWGSAPDPQLVDRQDDNSYTAGMTAVCLYALGASGCVRKDPAVEKGLTFIYEHRRGFEGWTAAATYANAVLVLALTRIDPVAYRTMLHEAADRLVAGQLSNGMWTYVLASQRSGPPARAEDREAWRKSGGGPSGIPDNSNTQFAVLALWAAQEIGGYDVPADTWEKVKKHFLKKQERDGGWSYQNVHRASKATMTAAGIVSLVYALTALDDREDALARARKHPALPRALRLVPLTPGARTLLRASWLDYYLVYSIERVGTVLDLDIGSWYVPGATWLVEKQRADGAWPYGTSFRLPPPDADKEKAPQFPYETALALLFLTRASRPYVTTRGGGTPEGPVTRKDAAPDTIEGLFDLYVATRAEEREALVPKLARREAVGLAIGKLRDDRQPVREAAFELLARLVDRPFLFDPAAPLDEREVMLGPIDAFWKEKGERLEWDEGRERFVTR